MDPRCTHRSRRWALRWRGKSVGDQATYAMPNGGQATVEIVSATPYTG